MTIYVTQENGADYEIPTYEQFKELMDECKWEQKSEKNWTESGFYYWHDWAICLGPNGNKITFEKLDFMRLPIALQEQVKFSFG